MRKPLNIEKINEMLKNINENLSVKVKEGLYKNNLTRLICSCSKCGYEWETTWASLSRAKHGCGCPSCSGRIRYQCIEQVQSVFDGWGRSMEILEDKFINQDTKMRMRCRKCGHEESYTFSAVKARKGCPNCETNFGKIDIDKIRDIVLNGLNMDIREDKYVDKDTKMNCYCNICGYEWMACWSNLTSGKGCPRCAGRIRKNVNELRIQLIDCNSRLIILNDEYGTKGIDEIQFRCTRCGAEWTEDYQNGKGRTRCRECEKHNTIYNNTQIERRKDQLKSENGKLYIIKCINENEEFYKVGVTRKTVNLRFRTNTMMPYKFKVIHEYDSTFYDVLKIEKICENILYEHSYIPKIKFDGYTECYRKINLTEILKEIQKYKDTN